MKFLHSMIRVNDLEASLHFFCNLLGLQENRRINQPQWQCTLVYLAAPENPEVEIELTHNWAKEDLGNARNFGHLAFEVENIYQTCQKLLDNGITINRPPHDGWMAFVKTPDNISIELLQKGQKLPPQEPWASMAKTGTW